jgi:hypothetical protein
VGGRWSTAWAGTPTASTLWGNILSWILPAETEAPLTVRVDAQETGEVSVVADVALNAGGGWSQVRPTRAHIIAPDGSAQDVDLGPAGPGRYGAPIRAPQTGAYVVTVSQEVEGAASLRGEAGWVAPYPAEFRQTGIDRPFLAQVASAGGGRVLDDAAQAVRPAEHATAARWPAWPALVILAGILWPLEIASRRFTTPAATLTSRLRSVLPTRAQPYAAIEPQTTADRLLQRKRDTIRRRR